MRHVSYQIQAPSGTRNETKYDMYCTTAAGRTRACLRLYSGNRYKISRTYRTVATHVLSFVEIGQEVRSLAHEEQICYSPLILILSEVFGIFSKICICDTAHIFYSCSKFPCDWSRNMGTSHDDQRTSPYLASCYRVLHEKSHLTPNAHSLHML